MGTFELWLWLVNGISEYCISNNSNGVFGKGCENIFLSGSF